MDQEVAGIWRPLAVSGRTQHSRQIALQRDLQLVAAFLVEADRRLHELLDFHELRFDRHDLRRRGSLRLACLRLAGFDVLPLLTTSAVLTAIIGLALQTTIANLFGGLSLQLDRTLVQGDWIETGRHSGRIVEIGWRSTQLITRDGDTLFLPNSQLVSGEVLNLSRPTGAHRASVRMNVPERYAPAAVRQAFGNAFDIDSLLVSHLGFSSSTP